MVEGGDILKRGEAEVSLPAAAAASNRSLQIERQTAEATNPNMSRTIPSRRLGSMQRGTWGFEMEKYRLLARSAGIRRNQNGRRLDSSPFRSRPRGREGARRRGRVHAQWFSNRGRIVDSASSEWRTAEGRRGIHTLLASPNPDPFYAGESVRDAPDERNA